MTDAMYFRLGNVPCMIWPSPEGTECIVQMGRGRPYVSMLPAADVLVVMGALGGEEPITAAEWHESMGTGKWPDGQSSLEKS